MKKGFTLIELLAVIVILAIIAIIAVPIVLNIIEESKNNAGLRSADFYLDAVELSIANSTLKNKNIEDGTYKIKDGDICLNADCTDKLEVEVNGDVPKSGTITITKGNISDVSIVLNEKTIVKNSEGQLVYQEVTGALKLCTANTTKVTALVWPGDAPPELYNYTSEEVGLLASDGDAFASGVTYTCNFIDDKEENNMTFFVLSSSENEVTLISGTDLLEGVAWSGDYSNHKDESEDKQALAAKIALANITLNWNRLDDIQRETIKLPTSYDIMEVTTGTQGDYGYIELPTWLNCESGSNSSGYWTSTPDINSSNGVWIVNYHGLGPNAYLGGEGIGSRAIRPVITISKKHIN